MIDLSRKLGLPACTLLPLPLLRLCPSVSRPAGVLLDGPVTSKTAAWWSRARVSSHLPRRSAFSASLSPKGLRVAPCRWAPLARPLDGGWSSAPCIPRCYSASGLEWGVKASAHVAVV